MHMSNSQTSAEYSEMTKEDLYEFLFEEFSEEIEGAEEYYENACYAQEIGDQQLASMLIKHAQDETRHAEEILSEIKREIPDLECNLLYPLLKKTVKWLKHTKEDIESFR